MQVRDELSRKAERRTTWVLWGGMAYMATQFGILARLTWWEYSWDIMEPVTYFITYGTAMAMYAYFVLTRQVRHQSTDIVWIVIKCGWKKYQLTVLSRQFIISLPE